MAELDQTFLESRRPYYPIVVYMVVSVLWIMFSDKTLAIMVPDQDAYIRAQTVKGWFFVLASSVLLYILINQKVDELVDQVEENFRQKQKLEAILRGMGEAVFVSDEGKRIIMVNEAMEKLSGYKEKELIGYVYSDKLHFVSEKTGKELFGIPESIHNKGVAANPEEPGMLIRKNGTRVAVDGIGAPYKDSSGRVMGGVGVIRDVTKAREIDKMKSDFVSLASHQLRSPLTGIKWFVELFLEGYEKMKREEMVDYVKKIGGSNQRLIDLVSDLLSVSRIESGKMKDIRDVKTYSLKDILRDSVVEIELLLKEKGARVEGVEVVDEDIKIKGDRTQLVQVFSNLFNNAVKFSPDGSKVTVEVTKNKKLVNVSIQDRGVGIPKNQMKRLFEKFFRADNVSKHIPGSGLGLYVVKRLLESHGGKVRIESAVGKGTKVYVGLPIMYNNK